jgi:hypothetical protein
MHRAIVASIAATSTFTTRTVTYGPYYSITTDGSKSTVDNSYYLYSPVGVKAGDALPIHIQFHGGGFTGGAPTSSANAEIEAFTSTGIHYMSVGYRLVATKYYYGSPAVEEEFIHAAPNGSLTLDACGRVLSLYNVRRGRTEFNTKCSFDAARALEHLLSSADAFGVDAHRISLSGSSAGGGEIKCVGCLSCLTFPIHALTFQSASSAHRRSYLTWVYHALGTNAARYTPRAIVYTMAQLDYPVENMLDMVWSQWADFVGPSTELSTILRFSDCGLIIGNPWCTEHAQTPLCNASFQKASLDRYCANETRFAETTIGDVMASQTWPQLTPHDEGIATLWYTSANMLAHQPVGPNGEKFALYVANALNSTAGMHVVHNALYARAYAKFAAQAGINYTVYYTDYASMRPCDVGSRRYAVEEHGTTTVYNYRSNMGWANRADADAAPFRGMSGSLREQLAFVCAAVGVANCTLAPGPSPGPSPGPGPSCTCPSCVPVGGCPGPLPTQCITELKKDCAVAHLPTKADCEDCIRSHAKDAIAHGCPTGPGAAQDVMKKYCVRATG